MSRSIAAWLIHDTANATMHLLGKNRFGVSWAFGNDGTPSFTDRLMFGQAWSVPVFWRGNTTDLGTGRRHIAVTYNGNATTNDPVLYIDGTVEATTESSVPSGTLNSDVSQNLLSGENGSNALDFDGKLGWLNYYSGIFTAEEVNRSLWWGRARGGMAAYYPWVTDKLTNEGTATATGTATGTTVIAMATPVVRPGSMMLGMGVGW